MISRKQRFKQNKISSWNAPKKKKQTFSQYSKNLQQKSNIFSSIQNDKKFYLF